MAKAAFQFTRPRGARLARCPPSPPARGGFNSRAHGGRDSVAPPTARVIRSFNSRAHGGRDFCQRRKGKRKMFQFTRPRGARPWRTVSSRSTSVSIHAPTGGATGLPRRRRRPARFNSRAHGGRDSIARYHAAHPDAFQFTRPRGARPFVVCETRGFGWFQFTRPRGARRPRPTNPKPKRKVSIHAPTGGATDKVILAARPAMVSIHAPTGGATAVIKSDLPDAPFQFTRPRGARHIRD